MCIHLNRAVGACTALLFSGASTALLAAPTREAAKVARTADLYFFGMVFACFVFVAGVIAWCLLRTPPGYVPRHSRRSSGSRRRAAPAASGTAEPSFRSRNDRNGHRHRSWNYREPLTAGRAMHSMRGMGRGTPSRPAGDSSRTRKWRYTQNGVRKSA